MKAAFYKGNKRPFNKLVSWWTRGPYSHVELVLDDGLCVSSSFMDGGVRYKRIVFDNANWDFIELGPEPSGMREKIYPWLGTKYDWKGDLGFVVRRVGEDPKKMFCDEFVLMMLGYIDPWRFDPNSAYASLYSKVNYGSGK